MNGWFNMSYLIYTIYFVFGITIGSFVNVCIFRLPEGKSIIIPPSHCNTCGKNINNFDLIPIISFLILRGRCRNCGTKLSILYPFIELTNGVLYLISFYYFGFTLTSAVMCLLFSTLTAIFMIDLKHKIIPDSLNIFILCLGVFSLVVSRQDVVSHLSGLLIVSVPIFIIALLTNGFGGGDVKLFAAVGLLLGFKLILLTAFIAIITGGIFGAYLLLIKNKKLKSEMPFGPFIVIGIFISSIWGTQIIDWYFGRLF